MAYVPWGQVKTENNYNTVMFWPATESMICAYLIVRNRSLYGCVDTYLVWRLHEGLGSCGGMLPVVLKTPPWSLVPATSQSNATSP